MPRLEMLAAFMQQPAQPESHARASGASGGIISISDVYDSGLATNLAKSESEEAIAHATNPKRDVQVMRNALRGVQSRSTTAMRKAPACTDREPAQVNYAGGVFELICLITPAPPRPSQIRCGSRMQTTGRALRGDPHERAVSGGVGVSRLAPLTRTGRRDPALPVPDGKATFHPIFRHDF